MSNKNIITLTDLEIFADEINKKVETANDLEIKRLLRKKYKITVVAADWIKEIVNIVADKYYYPQEGLAKIIISSKDKNDIGYNISLINKETHKTISLDSTTYSGGIYTAYFVITQDTTLEINFWQGE